MPEPALGKGDRGPYSGLRPCAGPSASDPQCEMEFFCHLHLICCKISLLFMPPDDRYCDSNEVVKSETKLLYYFSVFFERPLDLQWQQIDQLTAS